MQYDKSEAPLLWRLSSSSLSYRRRGTRKYRGVLTALALLHLIEIRPNSVRMAFRIFRFIVFPLTALWSITGALTAYCPITGTSLAGFEIGGLSVACDPTSTNVFCESWCCASNTYACLAATSISSCAGRNSQLGALAACLSAQCSCRPRVAADPA